MAFGLFAPLFTRLMLATPPAFIAALGGLAMLRVLQAAFVTAFSGRFTLGALVTFVVTVADVTMLNIGAAFWGLVAGLDRVGAARAIRLHVRGGMNGQGHHVALRHGRPGRGPEHRSSGPRPARYVQTLVKASLSSRW